MPVFYISSCSASCSDCRKTWTGYGWNEYDKMVKSVRSHAKRTGHCVYIDQTRVYDYGGK